MADENLPVIRQSALTSRRVDELRRASEDLEGLEAGARQDLLRIVGVKDVRRSSALVGCLGGAVGCLTGVGLPALFVGVTPPVIALGAPIGVFAGVVIALLAWRGPTRLRMEWNVDRLKLFLNEVDERIEASRTQIDALPDHAPREIIDEMWRAHRKLVAQRSSAESDITADSSYMM